jgi:Kelch motif
MSRRLSSAFALTSLAILLVVGLAGCGGGDGIPPLFLTITNCDATTFASYGVVCVDFTVQGIHPGPFDLLAQFAAGFGAPLENATPIPPALAAQLGITPISGPITSQSKNSVAYRFCWFAGADLGFLATTGVQIFLTPVALGSTDPIGTTENCGPLLITGGGQTQSAIGPPVVGRAGHCDEHVGGTSIMVNGGFGPSGTGPTPLDTIDRLTFNSTGGVYSTNPFALQMQVPRAHHACSFFLDPTTERIKVLMTGGDSTAPATLPNATGDIYSFTPTESVLPTTGTMNVARRNHTATWIPSNKVVIIGGSNGTAPLCSIEIFDPVTGLFTLQSAALITCRENHSASLLPSGKILIAGGSTALAAAALTAELYDPKTGIVMPVAGSTVDRIGHTATRLANGWVLLAGGFLASNTAVVSSSSQIFEPELGGMGSFTSLAPLMTFPRALHADSLLGDGHALLTGGQIAAAGCPIVTQTAELFLPETLTFTPTISMAAPRVDHSSTAANGGFVAIVGGTNDAGCITNFLSSVEVYPFENQNPVVTSASVVTTGFPGLADISIGITDEDADGGYVIIRWRPAGGGMFMLPTLTQQVPSSAGTFPNMQVDGIPSIATPYAFRWDFAADGLTTGTAVDVEIIPVGATLGTPVIFVTALP